MAGYSQSSSLAAYQSVAVHGGVAAADPHRLIVMLMDGAVERIVAARGAMENGEQSYKSRMIHRAVEIVSELRSCLNFELGGDIAVNMASIYDYVAQQLLRANMENRPELLDEANKLLRELRSAWIAISPANRGGAGR